METHSPKEQPPGDYIFQIFFKALFFLPNLTHLETSKKCGITFIYKPKGNNSYILSLS